jgi:hypothetical protein
MQGYKEATEKTSEELWTAMTAALKNDRSAKYKKEA